MANNLVVASRQVSAAVISQQLKDYLCGDGRRLPIEPMTVTRALVQFSVSELQDLEPLLQGCADKHRAFVSADYENGFQTALDALRHRLKRA